MFNDLKELFKKYFTKEKNTEFGADTANERNDLRTMESPPKVTAIKKKYVYLVILGIIFIIVGAMMYGVNKENAAKEKHLNEKKNQVQESKVVTGEHLTNIPANYTDAAAAEKNKKDKEKQNELDIKKEASLASKNNVTPAPQMPQQPIYPVARITAPSPAEKARAEAEKKRQEALSSPIGFKIKD